MMGDGGTNNIRYAVLGDVTNFKDAMSQVEKIANTSAEKVTGAFKDVGSFLTKTIGFIGVVGAIEGAVDSASKLASSQNVQATILKDQIKNAKVLQSLNIQTDSFTHQSYSKTLSDMATVYSLQTGINRQQVTSAQTLLMTNQDMAKMFTTGAKEQTGAFKGMNTSLVNAVSTAGDLAAVMSAGKGGGGGGIAMSAKMLNRMLTDPAKHLSAMSRFGVTLSDAEQNQLKSVEKTNGLYKARQLLLSDIQKHIGGAAQAAMSPIERLQNDFSILYQDFGQIFLPILDAMAQTLTPLITALEPILQNVSRIFSQLGTQIGTTLGDIFAQFKPLFDLIVQSIVPAILSVVQPLTTIFLDVITPLSKAFNALLGPGKVLTELFAKLSIAISKPLADAAVAVSDAFTKIGQGNIDSIFKSLADSLVILAPVLPSLAIAFSQLVVALTPLAVQVLQGMAFAFRIFADAIAKIAPVISAVATGISKLVTNSGNLGKVLAILAGVWFTRNLFLTPIMAAGGAIGGLMTKMGQLGRVASSTGGVVKDVFNHRGIGESIMGRSKGYAGARTLEEDAELLRLKKKNNPKDEARIKELESKIDNPKSLYQGLKSFEESYKERGGGLKGIIAGFKNFSTTAKLGQVNDHATDQLSATNNLVQALNNLTAKIGGITGGSNGNSLENNLKNKVEGKLKSEVESKVKGRIGGLVKNFITRGAGEEAATLGVEAGGEAAAEGGILAAGAASGAATLGVGLAVAGVTVAYMKWHKQINHAIGVVGHHLENGVKDVGKFGVSVAKDTVKGVEAVGKGAAHLVGGLVHGIGGFFGGLFGGGGSKPKENNGGGENRKMTFTGGALNVHMMSHSLSSKKAAELMNGLNTPRVGVSSPAALQAYRNEMASSKSGVATKPSETINVTVSPGAFVLNVNGSIDSASMADVKNHVAEQFNQLQYSLKVIGR